MKIKECYLTLIYIKVCHTPDSPEHCIYTKDTTVELTLKAAQNTQKRNKIGHFRSLMKFSCIYLGKLVSSNATVANIMFITLKGGWIL